MPLLLRGSDVYKKAMFKSHLKISRLVRPISFMIISNGRSQRAQCVIDTLLG